MSTSHRRCLRRPSVQGKRSGHLHRGSARGHSQGADQWQSWPRRGERSKPLALKEGQRAIGEEEEEEDESVIASDQLVAVLKREGISEKEESHGEEKGNDEKEYTSGENKRSKDLGADDIVEDDIEEAVDKSPGGQYLKFEN